MQHGHKTCCVASGMTHLYDNKLLVMGGGGNTPRLARCARLCSAAGGVGCNTGPWHFTAPAAAHLIAGCGDSCAKAGASPCALACTEPVLNSADVTVQEAASAAPLDDGHDTESSRPCADLYADLVLPCTAPRCCCRFLQMRKHDKLPPLPVWVVDLDTMTWTSLATTGDIPTARGGHSVSTAQHNTAPYGQTTGLRLPLRRSCRGSPATPPGLLCSGYTRSAFVNSTWVNLMLGGRLGWEQGSGEQHNSLPAQQQSIEGSQLRQSSCDRLCFKCLCCLYVDRLCCRPVRQGLPDPKL